MKKIYEAPVSLVYALNSLDVIAASGQQIEIVYTERPGDALPIDWGQVG